MEPISKEEEAWNLGQIRQYGSRLNAKPIGSVIRQLMARSGYGQTQAAEALLESWRQAAGPALAKSTRPGNISRGVLQIFVADSSSLQELHLCKKQLVAAMNSAMPQAGITDIRARVAGF